jgi:hypothetical protein
MSKGQPLDMEAQAGGAPNVDGREIKNPDNNPQDRVIPAPETDTVKEVDLSSDIVGMKEKLEHVPKEMRERVAKLTRDDLAMPNCSDPEALQHFLKAEKIVRDKNRQKTKKSLRFDNVPRQDG